MRAVGIRELKNRLSEYLRLVKAGEEILITDRGEVVAELRQVESTLRARHREPLESLVRAGHARPGGENEADLYPALSRALTGTTAAALLAAERGER